MSDVHEHYVSSAWRADERGKVAGEVVSAIARHREDIDPEELYRWYRLIPKLVRLEPEGLEKIRDEFAPFVQTLH